MNPDKRIHRIATRSHWVTLRRRARTQFLADTDAAVVKLGGPGAIEMSYVKP